jgi:transcriptional regulator with PAS, ATPase and Fis domain
VRVIATSNRDLELAVSEGKFRQDLFYRLNVVPIDLPPLRQRADDIPELCRHFLHQIAKREQNAFRHIEPEALRMLQHYPWPGNVRELQNILERAAVLEMEPGVIRAVTLEPWLRKGNDPSVGAVESLAGKPLADIEKQVILTTLQQFPRSSAQDRQRPGHWRAHAGDEDQKVARRRGSDRSGIIRACSATAALHRRHDASSAQHFAVARRLT